MKKNVLKSLKVALFGVSLVLVGTITWLSVELIMDKQTADENNNLNNEKKIVLEKSQDVPVKLIEYESNGSYFFGYEGLQAINKRIKSDLQFGPEIESLKKITINNLSILNSDVSGQYNPFTSEISISISNLIPQFQNIPLQEKIDLVFQTIFHEYGHHFANTYITSISTNDIRNSKKLFYENKNKSVHKNIPKKFLEAFEKSLHYNDDVANNLLSNNKNSISSKKSASEFYKETNGINIKNKNRESDYLKINDFNLTTKIPSRGSQRDFLIDSNKYTYLFSIDELLTRKLQQISYIDNLNGSSIANQTTTFTGTEYRGSFSPTTIAMDISKNRKIDYLGKETYKINDELILMDYPYGGNFTDSTGKKHVVQSTAENLWMAYFDIGGYNYGISQIFLNNSSEQVSKNTRSPLMKNDFTNIMFSGFLDKSKKYKSLLLKDVNGSYKKYDFLKNNYEYKFLSAKSNVLSKQRDLTKMQNKFGYTTPYINIAKVDLSWPIKVWNDKNNNNKLDTGEDDSLTVSPDRPTTTFRESFMKNFEDGTVYKDEDIKNRDFYEVISNGKDVYLQLYKTDNKSSKPLKANQTQGFSNLNIGIFQDIIMLDNWQYKKKR